MAGENQGRLTMAEAHRAVARGGGKPSRLNDRKFTFSSKVCHGGNSPAGCWAQPNDQGEARFFCHRCKGAADGAVRALLGLPPWQPAYTQDKPGYRGEREILSWQYHNAATGETLKQVIDFRPAGNCQDPACPDGVNGKRCKHPYYVRDPQWDGQPIAGFALHCHSAAGQKPDFLTLCEGQTAADRVAEAGYTALSYIGGAGGAGFADYSCCLGQYLAIAPDNDLPGEIAALDAAVAALDAGALGIYILPPVTLLPGADLADISPGERMAVLGRINRWDTPWRADRPRLALELAVTRFRHEIWTLTRQDGRRMLSASTYQDFSQHIQSAWEYIGDWNTRLMAQGHSPRIYRNEHSAVEVTDSDSGPRIRRLETAAYLRLPTAEAILWNQGYQGVQVAETADPEQAAAALRALTPLPHSRISFHMDGNGVETLQYSMPKAIYPGDQLLSSMAKSPDFSLPHMQGISRCPYIYRGRMILEEGYHPKSEVYMNLVGAEILPMTLAQAVGHWRALLQDFPFKSDADLAAAMAYALTPLVRHHVRKAPSFLFNKPASRTGASLLVSLIVSIITGQPSKPNLIPANREEFRKEIMSILYNGNPMPVLDNVEDKLDDPTLAMAITTETAKGRILGRTEEVELSSINATWAATGNKLAVGTDFIGRSVVCNLDARVAIPGERTGPTIGDRAGQNWAFPFITDHALENRSIYLSALVAIIQSWIDAKYPKPQWSPPALGGFEKWMEWVPGCLAHAGFKDLLENKEEFAAEADLESSEAAQLVQLWWDTHRDNPTTVQQMFGLAGYEQVGEDTELIVNLDRPSPKAMGAFLRKKVKGMVFELEDSTTVYAQSLRPRSHREAGRWQLIEQHSNLI